MIHGRLSELTLPSRSIIGSMFVILRLMILNKFSFTFHKKNISYAHNMLHHGFKDRLSRLEWINSLKGSINILRFDWIGYHDETLLLLWVSSLSLSLSLIFHSLSLSSDVSIIERDVIELINLGMHDSIRIMDLNFFLLLSWRVLMVFHQWKCTGWMWAKF